MNSVRRVGLLGLIVAVALVTHDEAAAQGISDRMVVRFFNHHAFPAIQEVVFDESIPEASSGEPERLAFPPGSELDPRFADRAVLLILPVGDMNGFPVTDPDDGSTVYASDVIFRAGPAYLMVSDGDPDFQQFLDAYLGLPAQSRRTLTQTGQMQFLSFLSDVISAGVGFLVAVQSDPNGENSPPECLVATSTPGEIWPPDHRFADTSIVGVVDWDGDPISIIITSIYQDEPVLGVGAGNTAPDGAGVGTDRASLRAERAGTPKVAGDGRVYHVAFTAEDGRGAECSGEVTVCVPHDQEPDHACVDEGPLFDSTSTTPNACGIGFELALVIPPLLWFYRRRRG